MAALIPIDAKKLHRIASVEFDQHSKRTSTPSLHAFPMDVVALGWEEGDVSPKVRTINVM